MSRSISDPLLDRAVCLPWRLSYISTDRAGGWRAWQVEFFPFSLALSSSTAGEDNTLSVVSVLNHIRMLE
jgi:hypothetical protein